MRKFIHSNLELRNRGIFDVAVNITKIPRFLNSNVEFISSFWRVSTLPKFELHRCAPACDSRL